MRNFIALAVLLLSASCASTQPLSKKPIDALVPELPFAYAEGGSFISVKGLGANYFSPGDRKILKVKVHEDAGRCVLSFVDGDNHLTQDCTGQTEVIVDLGKHRAGQGDVMGISVATQKLGTQLGWFYPSLRTVRTPLAVDFKCPQQTTSNGLSTCSRPATFDFVFSAQITDNFAGKIQYARACDGENVYVNVIEFKGATTLPFTLQSERARYCQVRLDVLQNQQADGTWAIKKSSTIHVRFYDPQYIPLPMPIIKANPKGGVQVCGAEDYEAISVDGVDYGSLKAGRCKDFDQVSEVIAWDSIGRVNWAFYSRGSLRTAATPRINRYKFYEDARPWVEREIKKCGLTEKCARKVIYSPKMKLAIRKWDASILYR